MQPLVVNAPKIKKGKNEETADTSEIVETPDAETPDTAAGNTIPVFGFPNAVK